MNAFNMTCEAVAVTLPDYLDETLEAWVRTSVQEHLGECMQCAALVRDLRNIEREAAALPDLVPARDLWAGIAEHIGAPVVSLEPVVASQPETPAIRMPPETPAIRWQSETPAIAKQPAETQVREIHTLPLRRRRFAPAWLGAAAAALVVLTAGTTYLLTTRAVTPSGVPTIASVVPVTVTPLPGDAGVDSGIAAPASDPELAGPDGSAPVDSRRRGASPASGRSTSGLVSRTPAQAVYEKEIDMLQAIMTWRRAELDPATAATIEKNLKIIDDAIAESMAALQRDPASSMLSDQLTHTLDKKVELLRTAAMLRTRT
ncbi:MAG TPA: hypothetical protein VNO75_11195 [Gemmatimonadaceae bacterium]|nr:hypothetical protein [Gemmatimonadaceae bacterium]